MAAPLDLEHKSAPTIDAPTPTGPAEPDHEGIVETLVAVTGVKDDVGDVIVPGAFTRTLRERKAKVCLGHDWNRPIGKTLDIKELWPGDPGLPKKTATGDPWPKEAGAVWARYRANLETEDGKAAFLNAKFFGPQESTYSIGYKTVKARHRGGTRYIDELDLFEYGPVLHPANRLATLQSIKSGEPDGIEVSDILASWESVKDAEPEGMTFQDYSASLLAVDVELKARRYVQDSTYWGYPKGTLIVPGMKPRGKKARNLRERGVVPSRNVGVADKPDSRARRGNAADVAVRMGDEGLDLGLPDGGLTSDARVRARKPKGKDEEHVTALLDALIPGTRETDEEREVRERRRDVAFERLLDEGITPDELREDLDEHPDRPNDLDDDTVADTIGRYTTRYREVAAEQAAERRGEKPAADEPVKPKVDDKPTGSTKPGKKLSTELATRLRDDLAATSGATLGNRLVDIAPAGESGNIVRGIAAASNDRWKREKRGSKPAKRISPEASAARSQQSFKLTPEQMTDRADTLDALAEALDDLGLGDTDQGDGYGGTAEYARRQAAAFRAAVGGGDDEPDAATGGALPLDDDGEPTAAVREVVERLGLEFFENGGPGGDWFVYDPKDRSYSGYTRILNLPRVKAGREPATTTGNGIPVDPRRTVEFLEAYGRVREKYDSPTADQIVNEMDRPAKEAAARDERDAAERQIVADADDAALTAQYEQYRDMAQSLRDRDVPVEGNAAWEMINRRMALVEAEMTRRGIDPPAPPAEPGTEGRAAALSRIEAAITRLDKSGSTGAVTTAAMLRQFTANPDDVRASDDGRLASLWNGRTWVTVDTGTGQNLPVPSDVDERNIPDILEELAALDVPWGDGDAMRARWEDPNRKWADQVDVIDILSQYTDTKLKKPAKPRKTAKRGAVKPAVADDTTPARVDEPEETGRPAPSGTPVTDLDDAALDAEHERGRSLLVRERQFLPKDLVAAWDVRLRELDSERGRRKVARARDGERETTGYVEPEITPTGTVAVDPQEYRRLYNRSLQRRFRARDVEQRREKYQETLAAIDASEQAAAGAPDTIPADAVPAGGKLVAGGRLVLTDPGKVGWALRTASGAPVVRTFVFEGADGKRVKLSRAQMESLAARIASITDMAGNRIPTTLADNGWARGFRDSEGRSGQDALEHVAIEWADANGVPVATRVREMATRGSFPGRGREPGVPGPDGFLPDESPQYLEPGDQVRLPDGTVRTLTRRGNKRDSGSALVWDDGTEFQPGTLARFDVRKTYDVTDPTSLNEPGMGYDNADPGVVISSLTGQWQRDLRERIDREGSIAPGTRFVYRPGLGAMEGGPDPLPRVGTVTDRWTSAGGKWFQVVRYDDGSYDGINAVSLAKEPEKFEVDPTPEHVLEARRAWGLEPDVTPDTPTYTQGTDADGFTSLPTTGINGGGGDVPGMLPNGRRPTASLIEALRGAERRRVSGIVDTDTPGRRTTLVDADVLAVTGHENTVYTLHKNGLANQLRPNGSTRPVYVLNERGRRLMAPYLPVAGDDDTAATDPGDLVPRSADVLRRKERIAAGLAGPAFTRGLSDVRAVFRSGGVARAADDLDKLLPGDRFDSAGGSRVKARQALSRLLADTGRGPREGLLDDITTSLAPTGPGRPGSIAARSNQETADELRAWADALRERRDESPVGRAFTELDFLSEVPAELDRIADRVAPERGDDDADGRAIPPGTAPDTPGIDFVNADDLWAYVAGGDLAAREHVATAANPRASQEDRAVAWSRLREMVYDRTIGGDVLDRAMVVWGVTDRRSGRVDLEAARAQLRRLESGDQTHPLVRARAGLDAHARVTGVDSGHRAGGEVGYSGNVEGVTIATVGSGTDKRQALAVRVRYLTARPHNVDGVNQAQRYGIAQEWQSVTLILDGANPVVRPLDEDPSIRAIEQAQERARELTAEIPARELNRVLGMRRADTATRTILPAQREAVEAMSEQRRADLATEANRRLNTLYSADGSPGYIDPQIEPLETVLAELTREPGSFMLDRLVRMRSRGIRKNELIAQMSPRDLAVATRENDERIDLLRRRNRPGERAELAERERLAGRLRDAGTADDGPADDGATGDYTATGDLNDPGRFTDAQLDVEIAAARERLRALVAEGFRPGNGSHDDAKLAVDVLTTEKNRRTPDTPVDGVRVAGVDWVTRPTTGLRDTDERYAGRLPDGRTGTVTRNGDQWSWSILGTGAADDSSGFDTYASRDDAMRAILNPQDADPDRGIRIGREPRRNLRYPAEAGGTDRIDPDEVGDARELSDEALGLSEDDDGELVVTEEVAERQDRVERLIRAADAGTLDLAGRTNDELIDTRRDVAAELRLQEAVRRRDAAAGRPDGGVTRRGGTTDDGTDGGDGDGITVTPARPRRRPGLIGAAEDYAEALDGGNAADIERTRARLDSSLRRSRTGSPAAQALREHLSATTTDDPAEIRRLAEAMRAETRDRRNAAARDRRRVKRLERERLRSLLGQVDAELRNRDVVLPDDGRADGESGDATGDGSTAATRMIGGLAFTAEDVGPGQGEMLTATLPDGRTGGVRDTGAGWAWFIRGANGLDDRGDGHTGPGAAVAEMLGRAPVSFDTPRGIPAGGPETGRVPDEDPDLPADDYNPPPTPVRVVFADLAELDDERLPALWDSLPELFADTGDDQRDVDRVAEAARMLDAEYTRRGLVRLGTLRAGEWFAFDTRDDSPRYTLLASGTYRHADGDEVDFDGREGAVVHRTAAPPPPPVRPVLPEGAFEVDGVTFTLRESRPDGSPYHMVADVDGHRVELYHGVMGWTWNTPHGYMLPYHDPDSWTDRDQAAAAAIAHVRSMDSDTVDDIRRLGREYDAAYVEFLAFSRSMPKGKSDYSKVRDLARRRDDLHARYQEAQYRYNRVRGLLPAGQAEEFDPETDYTLPVFGGTAKMRRRLQESFSRVAFKGLTARQARALKHVELLPDNDPAMYNEAQKRYAGANYRVGDHTMRMTHGDFDHQPGDYRRAGKTGWVARNDLDSLDYTTVHEMGHHLDSLLTVRQRRELFRDVVAEFEKLEPGSTTPYFATLNATEMWEDKGAESWVKMNNDLIAKHVSGYAKHSSFELIAELWTEFRGTKDPGPLARVAGKHLMGALSDQPSA